MNRYVVDSNVLFSMLMTKKDIYTKVALSLELLIPPLTRDKELYNGLKNSKSLQVELFNDFIDRIGE